MAINNNISRRYDVFYLLLDIYKGNKGKKINLVYKLNIYDYLYPTFIVA